MWTQHAKFAAALAPAPGPDELLRKVRSLLWDEHPECCGRPVIGAQYGGQQEQLCCGVPEMALLNDAQIVASLRALLPLPERDSTKPAAQQRPALVTALRGLLAALNREPTEFELRATAHEFTVMADRVATAQRRNV